MDRALGGAGEIAPLPRIEEVADLDVPERSYPIITGDYASAPTWERHPIKVGTPVAKPTPIFTKLDESVIEGELLIGGLATPGADDSDPDQPPTA